MSEEDRAIVFDTQQPMERRLTLALQWIDQLRATEAQFAQFRREVRSAYDAFIPSSQPEIDASDFDSAIAAALYKVGERSHSAA